MSFTLHNADCFDVMAAMDADSVDLIVCDPPYYKVKGESWDRQWKTREDYLSWLGELCGAFSRVLRPNGSLYLFASPQMSWHVEGIVRNWFAVLNRITWKKPAYSTKAEMNPKELQRQFFPVTETVLFCEHWSNRGLPFVMQKAREESGFSYSMVGRFLGCNGRLVDKWETQRGERDACEPSKQQFEKAMRIYGKTDARYEDFFRPFNITADLSYTDVWEFPTVQSYKGKHPCEKPLGMIRQIVQVSSRDGGTVLDPCMGSGVVGVACAELGRKFIGIESDNEHGYFAKARARIADAYGEPIQPIDDKQPEKNGVQLTLF